MFLNQGIKVVRGEVRGIHVGRELRLPPPGFSETRHGNIPLIYETK